MQMQQQVILIIRHNHCGDVSMHINEKNVEEEGEEFMDIDKLTEVGISASDIKKVSCRVLIKIMMKIML